MASQGFIELLRLADRGQKRAQGQLGSEDSLWSGIAFRIGDVNLIAPLGEVSEVVSVVNGTLVPKVQPWMKGITNLRGRLLPLTDLSEFTGMTGQTQQSQLQRKTLVVDSSHIYSGLIVDQVYGIQHLQKEHFVGTGLQVNEGLDPYLHGYFKNSQDQVWHVFMISHLAKDERYLNAAI